MADSLSSAAFRLYYVHDPMCSWCWAFHTVREKLLECLPESVRVHFILGGLASDTDQPMPEELKRKIQSIWLKIQAEVPGTLFNFDYWNNCKPRRATYAACRAVIAAAGQSPDLEREMILSIQEAYYCEARNPSDRPVLIDLAAELGLDPGRFAEDLDSSQTIQELKRQIAFTRTMGVRSFPALVLENLGRGYKPLHIDYHHAGYMLEQIMNELERGS
ncbi:MAG: DsbA family protein [Methylococcales bacterium]